MWAPFERNARTGTRKRTRSPRNFTEIRIRHHRAHLLLTRANMTEIRISRKALTFDELKQTRSLRVDWLRHGRAQQAKIRKHKSQFDFNCQMKKDGQARTKITSIRFYYYYSLNRRLLLSITYSSQKYSMLRCDAVVAYQEGSMAFMDPCGPRLQHTYAAHAPQPKIDEQYVTI